MGEKQLKMENKVEKDKKGSGIFVSFDDIKKEMSNIDDKIIHEYMDYLSCMKYPHNQNSYMRFQVDYDMWIKKKEYDRILNNKENAKEFVNDFMTMGVLSNKFKSKYCNIVNIVIDLFNKCLKKYDL